MEQQQQQKKSQIVFLTLVVALLSFTAFLVIPFPKKHKRQVAQQAQPQVQDVSARESELVNKHLFMTDQAIELSKEKVAIENQFANIKVGESILPKKKMEPQHLGVDHSPDSNESTAFDDLNRYPKTITATNPDHIIQGQLSDQDATKRYEIAYREEYIRQFVENARRAGYDVELNDDLVVVSVRPIRNPSGELGPQAK